MTENKCINLMTQSLDDIGNSERLLALHGNDVRYSHELCKWYVWSGTHWKLDESGDIYRKACSTVKEFQVQALKTVGDLTKQLENEKENIGLKKRLDSAKAILSFANKSGYKSRLEALVGLASSHSFIATSRLDTSHNLIVCANGTIDLFDGSMRRSERNDYSTMISNAKYEKQATAPTFEKFLNEIFAGDKELIDFIQVALGYCLTGATKEQCFFICYGSGSNGKSTLFDLIAHIANEYCQYIPVNTLLDNEKRGNEASPELARARGKRIVFATESQDTSYLNEAMIKTITGGEKISVRPLYSQGFEYIPTYKIWLSTNHKPVIKGTDNGIWRRVRLIPFNITIPPEQQDKELMNKLEAESSGVFAWLVQGAVKYYRDGLNEPEAIKAATGDYRAEMDVLADFISDCTIVSEDKNVRASIMYEIYESWRKVTAAPSLTQTTFGKRLTEKGFNKKRSTIGVIYEGLQLSEQGESYIHKNYNPFEN